MKQKTKRIVTIILCVLLALTMVLPFFALNLNGAAARSYTVSLNSSVEGSAALPPINVDMSSDYILPKCSFSNPGNTFAGWFCVNDGKTYAAGDAYKNTGNYPTVTFFAAWKADPGSAFSPSSATSSAAGTVTVTFAAGRETAAGSVTPAPVQLQSGGSFVLPKNTFTAEGYEFFGWNVSGVIMLPGEKVANVAQDMVVTADWRAGTASSGAASVASTQQAVEVTVRLLPGAEGVSGGEVVLGPFAKGANFVFSPELRNQFSYAGYSFAGWRVGTQTYYDGNFIALDSDITATATWKASSAPSAAASAVSSVTATPQKHDFTDKATGVTLDGGLTFGNTVKVKQYTDKSVTDVYTAMLLQSNSLMVGYNIYVSSDISFTGGRLTIPVSVPESAQDGAIVLYHVVDTKEVILPKYKQEQFENQIVFDSSSGQPLVSWVDLTSDAPRQFALSVGNGKYAEIYIFPGTTAALELDVSFLSPFVICKADAKLSHRPGLSINLEWRDDEGNLNVFWPVAIALTVALVCVAVIVAMRVSAAKKASASKKPTDDYLSSKK